MAFCALLYSCSEPLSVNNYSKYPIYSGNDLGVTWSPEQTLFKVYAPTADSVVIYLYENGDGGEPSEKINTQKAENGTWKTILSGDRHGTYYTWQIKYQETWLPETCGIYAKAVGLNGKRGMITDFSTTNPDGWDNDNSPQLDSKNDVILYELQIRDFSVAENSGMKNKGLYTAFTETNIKNSNGQSVGIDHLAEMGVTHVHLLPAFDFRSIDESLTEKPYNWGYDPLNYNVPEGSFSSDPRQAEVRIKEFKQMVMALHEKGIRVIMDVVYNHTGPTENSPFNLLVPGYYYRHNEDGSWSNASACGNETASERPMMRKFMTESLLWWMEEYHIDGFRFDLMGIHDIETMNAISKALHQANSSVFLYGEGWTAGNSPMPDSLLALKKNTQRLHQIAAFSDDLRDGIKGHWASETDSGFINGKNGLEESIKFGVVASGFHPQVNYSKVNYSDAPWTNEPAQCINYVTCHDNHTLYDKLRLTTPSASTDELKALHKLANTIILTAQGIPFLHAGVEFMRSKDGVHNSFESPDAINQINWDLKSQNIEMVQYYQDLITLRKAHPAFRMPSAEMIRKHLAFYPSKHGIVSYKITDHANGDKWKTIAVMYNATKKAVPFSPGEGTWTVVFDKNGLKNAPLSVKGSVNVAPQSAIILAESE